MEQDEHHPSIEKEIQQADTIVLVYDLNDLETITPLSHTWLPLVEKNNNQIPIILIGNKLDLVLNNTQKYNRTNV